MTTREMSIHEPARTRQEAAMMTAQPAAGCTGCARRTAHLQQTTRATDFVPVEAMQPRAEEMNVAATVYASGRCCGSAAGRAILHTAGVSLPGVSCMRRCCRVLGTIVEPEPNDPVAEPEENTAPVPQPAQTPAARADRTAAQPAQTIVTTQPIQVTTATQMPAAAQPAQAPTAAQTTQTPVAQNDQTTTPTVQREQPTTAQSAQTAATAQGGQPLQATVTYIHP